MRQAVEEPGAMFTPSAPNTMKHFAAALVLSLTATSVVAQPQPLNSSFETWQNLGAGTEEPEEWSSIKTSDGGSFVNNFAPQVCWRSDDAHTGSYSVNVRTVTSPIGAANGIVTCGRVHAELDPANGRVFTEASDPQWHQALTSRPDSVVGWYKTTVQTGDFPTIDAIVHTGAASIPENGTIGNWVATANWDGASATVGEWTRFSAPFNYFSVSAPAYFLMVLTSGDSLVSQIGTQSWYDDIALIYNVACTPSLSTVIVTEGSSGAIDVGYSTGGIPTGPTTFTVELSDASGDFSAATVIGSIVSSTASGSISCSVPAGTPAGTGYAIRVVTDSPFYAPVGCGVQVELQTGVVERALPHVIQGGIGQVTIDGQLVGGAYSMHDAQGRLLREGRLTAGRNTIVMDHAGLITVTARLGAERFVERILMMR